MAHLRKGIRDAIVARLAAGNTAAGTRVFSNRAKPLFNSELPCILVYSKTEAVEVSIESPREYKRSLSISLELVTTSTSESTMDDDLDAFCEQVETLIFSEETFGGLVSDTILGETEMDLIQEGEKPVGAAKISLTMPYYQQLPGDLSGDLDDFEEMDTTIETPEGATISGTDEVPQ